MGKKGEKRKYYTKCSKTRPLSWSVCWKSKDDFGQEYLVADFFYIPGIKIKDEAQKYADMLNGK